MKLIVLSECDAFPGFLQSWLRINRHGRAANYTYVDGHAALLRWAEARHDQFPDHIVRRPLGQPPL